MRRDERLKIMYATSAEERGSLRDREESPETATIRYCERAIDEALPQENRTPILSVVLLPLVAV